MRKVLNRVSKIKGLPPGTLVYTGKKFLEKTSIQVMDYNESRLEERAIKDIEECSRSLKEKSVTWINVTGLTDTSVIESVGKKFGIHQMVLEDILDTNQRPKAELFEDYIFIVLKMMYYNSGKEIESEQVSLVLGKDYMISFQEREGDVFETVRKRLREAKGKMRKMGSDFLGYAILDAIVDNYFSILERVGDDIEGLEEKVISNNEEITLKHIHRLKKELLFLRKSVWPLREVISSMQRDETGIVKKSMHIYLRDLYDHTVQVMDTLEIFRDMLSNMVELYMSSISNRMNEVMKVLTIIATIFIPLTFITGVYGMNFRYMPELASRLGYPAVWLVIVLVALTMFLYFKKKKWF